jgi:hypothetical protein
VQSRCSASAEALTVSALLDRGRGTGFATGATVSVISVIPAVRRRIAHFRFGATHFLTKTLPKVAAEMALSVLAYNLTRVINIVGSKQLMAALAA